MNNIINEIKMKNILYAEDEEKLQESMEETLQFFFNKVFIANDGEEALQIFEEEQIDIAILDIEMPKLNGIEVAKKLREKNPEIKIIFLSAYSDQNYLLDAIKIKVEDYIIKPFKLEEFIAIFQRAYKNEIKEEKVHLLENGKKFYEIENIIEDKKEKIKLGEKEAQLLKLLINTKPNILTKRIIDEELWNYEMTEASYRSLIRNLRQKIGKDLIVTISGVGVKIN